MRRAGLALVLAALAAGLVLAQERPIPAGELKSGSAFRGSDLRALQNDDFANPGMLWVERGEKLWSEPAGKKTLACASCHKDTSMRGAVASYPKIDKASGKLLNLEGRINLCRTERMGADPLRYESEELLTLTSYLPRQSLGAPIATRIDGAASAHFEAV